MTVEQYEGAALGPLNGGDMSEKEVREAATQYRGAIRLGQRYEYEGDMASERLTKALSQPPDLVVLLREIEERLVAVNTHLKDTIPSVATYDQLVGMQNALYSLQDHIQETVRLTDDGWEWVE